MTRDEKIEACVAAARRPLPQIAEVREMLYDDGVWRTTGGAPWGVKSVKPYQTRIAGYCYMDKDGTRYGLLTGSKEELVKRWNDGQDKDSAAYRTELERMTMSNVDLQFEYWCVSRSKA